MADQRSSSSFPFTYDVFLSFRREDTTGFLFTPHLLADLHYRGIRTFVEDDDKELRKGDDITPTIVKAIEESRIAIIVFSENYAASSFCLDVLAAIVDNFDQGNHRFIIPVFYDVDPSDVRHQRGNYGKALARHEEKFKDNMEKVQKWRNTLHQVASLHGWDFRIGYMNNLDKFHGEIVRWVSKMVNRAPLPVPADLVGLESRLEEVWRLLRLTSSDREFLNIGFYGMQGIGKSALAHAVYNSFAHLFEVSCFLPNIREISNKHGLVTIQKMLLSEISGKTDIQLENVSKGVSMIKDLIRQKKVLLILDDVSTPEQLEALVGGSDWFGPGSRVIITTRDRHLLAFHGVERIYEVQLLNHQDSLQLLSHQVFKQSNFDPRHTEILNEFVSYASGLPLALEVIGSYLFGKSVDEWKNALHRFKRIPPEEIQMTLKTIFDALREDEQSVFLDIACCFKGYEMENTQHILCAHHGYNVKVHIKVLIDNSLVSISSDGKVTLHPLIEGMGKELVRQESLQEPGKRSRLWFPEDIVQVLKNNTGTSNIEIIHLDSSLIEEAIKWDGEAFKKMKNLRTLIIRRCHFSEAPKYLPNSLRVLEWREYSSQELPPTFDTNQLDICKLLDMDFVSPRLKKLLKESTSLSDPEVLQISISVPEVFQTSLQRVYEDDKTWRIVGLVSSVVGLLCCAFSSSFIRLIRGWTSLKFFLYGVLSLVIITTIFIAKKSSPKQHVLQKLIGFAVMMFIAVYTFYYDKAVNGKPDILGLVSNAVFALVTLTLSRLIKFGHEMGIFSFFLSCLVVQLWTINWKLIFVAIVFCCPLFIMHSSSDS